MPIVEVILEHLATRDVQDTESLSLQLMACGDGLGQADALGRWQHASGAWSAGHSTGPANAFHTAMALLAMRTVTTAAEMPESAAHAFAWLDSTSGVENHWLWKWKFRYFDKQVRFDITKTGWPWVEGTISWVAPTAMCLLAYRAWKQDSLRLDLAASMLLDRACPGGGWNAGNSEVFNVALDPHPDFTAMALLALREAVAREHPMISKSLGYLSQRLRDSRSLYSLAWAVLALTACKDPSADALAESLRRRLSAINPIEVPVRTLALAVLASERPRRFPFGGLP